MTGSGTLETLAEVSIAFAGFSSLVVVFRSRGTTNWLPQEISTLWTMVGSSLACLLFALLPLALHLMNLADVTVWRICSALLCVTISGGLFALRQDDRRLRDSGYSSLRPTLARFREPIVGTAAVLLLANALWIAGPGLYVVGLITLLGLSSAGLLYFLSFLGTKGEPGPTP